MKQFEMDTNSCKGASLEAGALFILKTALKERIISQHHHHHHEKLITPSSHADKKVCELEERLMNVDKRLKRGLSLLIAKMG